MVYVYPSNKKSSTFLGLFFFFLTSLVSTNSSAQCTISTDQVVCYNATAADVTLTGTCGTIQWQKSTDKTNWSNISSATTSTLTGGQIGTLTQTTYIRAQLTDNSVTTASNVVSLRVNNALQLDGSDDYVNIGKNAALNFMSSNFTIEAWVYVPSTPKASINAIFSKNYPSFSNPGYMLGFNSWNTTNLKLVFEHSTSVVASTKTVTAGAWNHTAAVVTGNGTEVTFYINGQQAGTFSGFTLGDASNVNELIGAMNESPLYSLQGSIDELRIWNVPRTQAELTANMDNNLVGNEAGLVAYYDFDQAIPEGNNSTVTTVLNRTSSSLNGTLTNFAKTGTSSNFVNGNHLSVISPDNQVCLNATSPRLYLGATGKTPTSTLWYSNTTSSTSGSTSTGITTNTYDAATNAGATKYFYADAIGTCAASTISNIARVVVEAPAISGNDNLYLNHTTTYTASGATASSTSWSSGTTATAAINANSGIITAAASGTSLITFTSAIGCTATKTLTVVPVQWLGTQNGLWSNAQNWNGNYVPTTLTNVAIGASAQNDLQLDASRTITNLTFNGAGRKMVLGNADLTVTTITSPDVNNYVKTDGTGKLIRSITNTSSVLYPVGNSTYNPVTITNKAGANDNFSARVVDAVYENGTSGQVVNTARIDRTWDIGKTTANGGSGVDFIFQWSSSNEVLGISNFRLNHHNGSSWSYAVGTSAAPTGTTTKTMAHTGYTGTFSPFGISSTSGTLPVTWLRFGANSSAAGIELSWSTAAEYNNAYFEVERSTDGSRFSNIGRVAATSSPSATNNYQFIDQVPASGAAYYRLKQVDKDGRFEYSAVVSYTNSRNNSLKVWAEANSGTIHIDVPTSIKGALELRLLDASGRLIRKETIQAGRSMIQNKQHTRGAQIVQLIQDQKVIYSNKVF